METLVRFWWGCKYGSHLELLYDPSNSTPGYTLEESENTNLKRYMYPNVHISIVYNSQGMKAT